MLKSNEIMIGNQFLIGKGKDWEEYVVIDEIIGDSVSLQGREFTTYLSVLEPIPITKELLLKNGFIEYGISTQYYEKEVGNFWITFKYDLSNTPNRDWFFHVDSDDRCSVASCDVQYVHQAQNLMNILGCKLEFKFD